MGLLLKNFSQAEYADTLDTSTLLAIIGDFDLSDPTQLATARQTLDLLKESAETEQESGFDPSGAGGVDLLHEGSGNARVDNESGSARSAQGWRSQTDDTSTMSHEFASLDLEGSQHSEPGAYTSWRESPEYSYTSEIDGLNEEDKEKTLIGIFPSLKPFDIKWTLKKYKGDASLAIDELMTQSFLVESGGRRRGIEAFSESDIPSRPRKGKNKKKRGIRLEDHVEGAHTGSPLPLQSPIESKWDMGKKDVEFLAEKTGMPYQQISTMYHQNGASLPNTISALISAHEAINIDQDDPVVQINAYELQEHFTSFPISHLEALIQLTQPSLSNARDLAKALTYHSARKGGIHIDFRHTPIDLSSENKPRSKSTARNAVYPDRPLDKTSAAALANNYHNARDTAFMQASAAYRKGKSDHLMGGAAAYYSQVGRDADARARALDSARADALVASQSSRAELDLHGVSVKDAVRIASDKVSEWWERERLKEGGARRGGEYRIVTGIGRHSEGGKGKLGPAVGKMLIREGWKVEVMTGVLVVTGLARR